MEPRSWDGPSIDRGVLRRMKRLDPNLVVTFSPYALDVETGSVIEQSRQIDPESGERLCGPVSDPAFYLWRKDDTSSHHFFVRVYSRFGDREVLGLESDLARFYRPEDMLRMLKDRADARSARGKASFTQKQSDKIDANQGRIRDLVFGGKEGKRDANAFSYPGQKSRASSAEGGKIELDPKADGWEL